MEFLLASAATTTPLLVGQLSVCTRGALGLRTERLLRQPHVGAARRLRPQSKSILVWCWNSLKNAGNIHLKQMRHRKKSRNMNASAGTSVRTDMSSGSAFRLTENTLHCNTCNESSFPSCESRISINPLSRHILLMCVPEGPH
jgi:hypothetical protein